LFSGELVQSIRQPAVRTDDGRQLRFSSLSSGHQELLPLWVVLLSDASFSSPKYSYFVEEPEAHLFPSSQHEVIQEIAAKRNRSSSQILLTTHSPYVPATLNNLLLAGHLSLRASEELRCKINDVVPGISHITPGDLRAYALEEGMSRSVLDNDGLIDAGYLDGVSFSIGSQFDRLLEIKANHVL